jgi:hypothetical protein
MTIFSIVIEDVANNYRMPRENFFTKKKKCVCVWRVLSINVQEEKIKNVDDIYSMKKKYLEKWF